MHLPKGLIEFLSVQAVVNGCSLEEEIQRRLANSVIQQIEIETQQEE